MANNNLTLGPRTTHEGRAVKAVPPQELMRDRGLSLPQPSPKARLRAQAPRSRPRVPDSAVKNSKTAELAVRVDVHDAVSLMNIVLAEAYEDGMHLSFKGGAFWHFDQTHWKQLSEEELGGVILDRLPAAKNRGGRQARLMIREVVDLLKMHQATAPDRAPLDDPLPIINVTDGELWIGPDGSVELRPHDPASGLGYCLDVRYDPAAECPLYDRTLAEIFSASSDTEALVDHWHELVGYVAQPSRPDPRIIVFWGAGNDGKTALAGLLVRLLGPERVAAMPVATIATNQFALGHLADKAMLLDDDVAVGTVLPDGLLKTISEAKVVTGELKHRDAFEFWARALPVLLCNTVPRLLDTSHGFYRRLCVFPYKRRFTEAEADRNRFARIWAEERSGVLNRALAGLRRLAQRGWKFESSEAVKQATAAWWAEATGLPSPNLMTQSALMPTRQKRQARVPAPAAELAEPRVGKARPNTAKPGQDVKLRVTLPRGGKQYTAQVEVSVTITIGEPVLPRRGSRPRRAQRRGE